MESYGKAIEEILKLKLDSIKENEIQKIHINSGEILNSLKLEHKAICERQCQNNGQSLTKRLFDKILNNSNTELSNLLKEMLEILYLKDSPMLNIVYQSFPTILRKYIENQDNKNMDLQQVTKVIYFNESGKYNRFLKDREDIHNSSFIRDLYSIHFNKGAADSQAVQINMEKSQEVEESQSSSTDKRTIKSIILSLIYRKLSLMNEESLQEYLKTIYFYCGGDANNYGKITSFYLLEKKNLFNLFKYSISQQQIEWMLLTLYELSIDSNKYKFQLLAAINMIYKKTANESMFKYSEIAQSIIHILEDEYIDIFS